MRDLKAKDIIEAHRRLSDCNVKFLEFVEKNPECKRRSNFQTLIEMNEKVQPWPTFINQLTKNQFKEVSLKVFDLIKSIPGRFFDNNPDKISSYYQVSLDMAKYFLTGVTEEHMSNLIARGDYILSPSGTKCIEYNIFSNLGGVFDVDTVKFLYIKHPIFSRFLREYNINVRVKQMSTSLYEYLVHRILNSYSSTPAEINIVNILPGFKERNSPAPNELYANYLFSSLLQAKFNNIKGEIHFCDYIHLNVTDGCVVYKNKKMDCVFEWYGGFVPVDILKVFEKGDVLVLNGPVSQLLSTKLNLVLLSENEDSDIFSQEEQDTIKKYIPWSRRLNVGETYYRDRKIDLIDFVLSNKEKFILKPAVGFGGDNVHLGCYTPDRQWKNLVESVLSEENSSNPIHIDDTTTGEQWLELTKKAQNAKNWIVQEHVESFSYLYQANEEGCSEYNTVWGFYIFGNQYKGEFLRVLPKDNGIGVINVHAGAKVSTVFEEEEYVSPNG